MNIQARDDGAARARLGAAALGMALALSGGTAVAQDFQRVAPRAMPPAPPPATPAPPTSPRRPVDPNLVILKELKAVRLVATPQALLASPPPDGATSQAPFAVGVIPELQPFIGKPLTMGSLARMENIVLAYYRARHRPFVSVVAPPQDIAGGVVQLMVTEYTAGKIQVTKNRWFSAAQILSQVRQMQGGPIDAARLDEDLAWLNQNPFRTVDLVTRPGGGPATTDLDLVVHDHFPLSVYAGYANNGSPTTQLDRWQLGAVWGNAFGSGQQLAYQFTASGDFFSGRPARPDGSTAASFIAHALTATIQLPWRDTLEVFGDYEQDHPNMGPDLAGLGVSEQVSVRYRIPLRGGHGFSQQLSLGYDFKSTNNNLDFGGTTVSANRTEIDQFPITYEASLRDSTGLTTITDSLVLSPGGLTALNTDDAFQPGAGGSQTGVAFAHARYAYDRLDVERDTALPRGLIWVLRATAQTSSGNLLPSEQLNVGGIDSVRGFEEEIVGGSEGVVLSTELRGPVWHPLGGAARGMGGDNLQADAFVDYAHVLDPETIAGAAASDTLASAGVGLRYDIGRHLSARVEAGFPFAAPSDLRGHILFANVAITVTP